MKSFKINLATDEYLNKRIVYSMLVGTALLVLFISGYNINVSVRQNSMLSEYKDKISRIEQNLAKKRLSHEKRISRFGKEEIAKIQNNTLFANKLIALDIFPWNRLLDTVEKKIPEDMILVNFTPSDDFKKLNLKGSTCSMKNITLFLKRLEESELLHETALSQLSVEESKQNADMKKQEPDIFFEIKSSLQMDKVFPNISCGNLGTVFKN